MDQNTSRQHPFDIMVRGRRQEHSHDEHGEKNVLSETSEEDINYGDLMAHVETLMGAASELKPIFNKFLPLLNKWMK
ncbi:hypothetical protein [Bacillus sp. AK031]